MIEAALLSIELAAFILLLLAVKRAQHRPKSDDLGLFSYPTESDASAAVKKPKQERWHA